MTHTNPSPERIDADSAGSAVSSVARIVCAEITSASIDTAGLAATVADWAAGAVVTFDGRVRNHDDGRGVSGISYSAHPSANTVMGEIAAEAADRPGLRAVGIRHRVGDLAVGDTALAVAVSADHRAEAFDAVRDIVEAVKARLPVWKQQTFADGSTAWSNSP
ncbi:molybdenum cofactor biosynthesis protein MoaE [Actinomyces sp.]|uniref:molybdenum cofactor biosynthesis protein MoaE n=1 Tax=Actinomyces sp. TaxID=29317 RepID=UPI0026DD1491|nr:molybdenum cofactor biosynthesis protein MoaE [Actinomyces sp.]MDO4899492.1 molybdenum cofactor biosynthesis protein MoaE [Actinomyces sp.]